MPEKLPVIELFGPTIAGEGAIAGQITFFIRFGICSFRCAWCDSMHAVDPKQIKANARYLNEDQIMEELFDLDIRANQWVSLSGGDPCVHNLDHLCDLLKHMGYRIAVETQGAIYQEWLAKCDLVTCSPKGPTSGMLHKLDMSVIHKYVNNLDKRLVFKIVSFGPHDLEFAERITQAYPQVPLYMTSGTNQHYPKEADVVGTAAYVLDGYRELAESILRRPALQHATLGVQLHVLLWGREKER